MADNARRTAQHWVATDYGDLDVLRLQETDVPAPAEGQVSIEVRAAGMNPADYKHIARGGERDALPVPIGYEIAGVISAMGPDTRIASGAGAVGDEVLAFRVSGGYASSITVPARDVFAKPAGLGFPEAANLLLAGSTAAEMLHVTGVAKGDTILVHGASGAVGVSVLQQAALIGARVIGTSGEGRFDTVRRFGAVPVLYGEELEQRVREEAPEGVAAALDCVGTDEAVDVSLTLVEDRARIVTIAAFARAENDGIRVIGGTMPQSAAYRDGIRAHLIQLAGDGDLVVPMAGTYPLGDALDALELLKSGHPGGKLALLP
ncbi:NADP-dependent oxidoreductase [Allobranchiibius sp. CTAmp26]|uniref:quinone oxidoreductase family protein n=1 Tax=Allobranchiibius sp. CTAmp26 TaxID=2815214 RepID=UPI001AA10023|nr:NADP-dependent oxidoreductase [Allobranchiibius sp. CTAmp26]MBO1756590.1 NADP-dependent oxidoreductase [Allobranchiibius sp. CTAmp26]